MCSVGRMSSQSTKISCDTPEATVRVAGQIGAQLAAGDTILLEGPIGAGKTHFARGLIQSVLAVPEDVPSPTFTLVQVYDVQQGELWHSDLYRLGDVSEIVELGLTTAFEDAICLVEWPDRLGGLAPTNALNIRFETGDTDEARQLAFSWEDAKWQARLKDIIDE